MKRLRKCFLPLYLAVATALSLMIGIGLPHIQTFSADIISRFFPVDYQVTYRDTQAQTVIAPVHFLSNTAIIATPTGDTVIPLSDAVFVCLENELRKQNTLRSGLLSVFLLFAATCLPMALATMAIDRSMRKISKGPKHHTRAAPRCPAASAHPSPTVPSAA